MTTMDPLCAVCGEPASNHTHPQRDAHLRIERDQLRAEVERLQISLTEITELELEGDASLDDAIVIAQEALEPQPVMSDDMTLT